MQTANRTQYFWETQKQKYFGNEKTWFWDGIFLPFLATRLVLVLAAWFAKYFQANPGYPQYIQKGWFLSPYFLVDIWSKWDARYYLSIIKSGYSVPKGFPDTYSNIAFFPLYPTLVKLISTLLPHGLSSDSMLLVIGVVLSNLCLLGGLALLYRIAVDYLRRDAESARQAVILALLFPASFFFSCFYTEGLFLFLSLAAFYAALKWKWPLAGLFGALAALTRLQGGFILLPLLWLYMDGMQWRVREIRREVFWLALIPVAVGAHIYRIYTLTQDFFSIFKAQQAWSKPAWFSPAQILLQLNSDYGRVIRIDTALALLFLVAGVIMLWKFPSRAFGVYTLGMLAIPLCISRMVSLSRYIAVLFPVFILLGAINRPRWVYRLLCLLFFTVQILYWVGWQNYYFIN